MADSHLPLQSKLEEFFNAVSHGVTAVAALIGLGALVAYGAISEASWSLLSAIVYGFSLVFLFSVSALYHAETRLMIKQKLRILDHASIFILIAGSYTPFLLMTIGGTVAWVLLAIQWTMALVGVVLKLFYTGRYEVLSVAMYCVMGWMIVVKVDHLYEVLPTIGFWLLLAGGVCYTGGIVFYLLDQTYRFSHFLWHMFVVAGSLCHFLTVLLYVL